MGALFERLPCSRLSESALISLWVTVSRRVAAKPGAIAIATVALAQEKLLQEEALVVEGMGAGQGGGLGLLEPQAVLGPGRQESTTPVTEADEPPGSPRARSKSRAWIPRNLRSDIRVKMRSECP